MHARGRRKGGPFATDEDIAAHFLLRLLAHIFGHEMSRLAAFGENRLHHVEGGLVDATRF